MDYSCYSLTTMTGRRSSDLRTTFILGAEMSWRVFIVGLLGAFVSLFAMLLAWPIIGQASIFLIPVCIAGFLWLFIRRSTRGLKLRTYEDLLDTHRARPLLNEFLLCGQVIGVDDEKPLMLCTNTVQTPYGLPGSSTYERRVRAAEAHDRSDGRRDAGLFDAPVSSGADGSSAVGLGADGSGAVGSVTPGLVPSNTMAGVA